MMLRRLFDALSRLVKSVESVAETMESVDEGMKRVFDRDGLSEVIDQAPPVRAIDVACVADSAVGSADVPLRVPRKKRKRVAKKKKPVVV